MTKAKEMKGRYDQVDSPVKMYSARAADSRRGSA